MSVIRNRILYITIVMFLIAGVVFHVLALKPPLIIYELERYHISPNQIKKEHLKTTEQFIGIAYYDLLNKPISTEELGGLKSLYESIGDKRLFEQLLIKKLMDREDIVFPNIDELRENIPQFIRQLYSRIFNRLPNALEAYQLKRIIESDPNISPKMIYFALMTSDEYRKY